MFYMAFLWKNTTSLSFRKLTQIYIPKMKVQPTQYDQSLT